MRARRKLCHVGNRLLIGAMLLTALGWVVSTRYSALVLGSNWCMHLYSGVLTFERGALVAMWGRARQSNTSPVKTLVSRFGVAAPLAPQTPPEPWLRRSVVRSDGVWFARVWPSLENNSAVRSRIILPLWLVIAGCLLGVGLLRRIARCSRRGFCPECMYSLTGNVSGVCPECGTRLSQLAQAGA